MQIALPSHARMRLGLILVLVISSEHLPSDRCPRLYNKHERRSVSSISVFKDGKNTTKEASYTRD